MPRLYKTRPIRHLVTAAYTLEELRTLCYDEFRPVYEDFWLTSFPRSGVGM